MVSLTQNLNLTFDAQWARSHLSDLGVFDSMRISSLSLGQQAQVSLALALARRPDLLILDEPLARLDPVARHDFVRLLLVATVEYGVAVLYSSHVVSELEDMADHIVVLNEGRVVVCDGVEEFLASHVILTGPRVSLGEVTRDFDVLDVSNSVSKSQVLALRNSEAVVPEGWSAEDAFLEELVLRYLGRSTALTVASPLALSEIPGGAR
jgi:ABC-2 type transport system ATP-binding protein